MVDIMAERQPDMLEQLLVVDFNLEVLQQLKAMKVDGMFGDITSVDTLQHANIQDARIIMSTIPDVLLRGTTNLKLVQTCRSLAPHATIIATADLVSQIDELKAAGANKVIMPYVFAGEHLAEHVISLRGELEADPV